MTTIRGSVGHLDAHLWPEHSPPLLHPPPPVGHIAAAILIAQHGFSAGDAQYAVPHANLANLTRLNTLAKRVRDRLDANELQTAHTSAVDRDAARKRLRDDMELHGHHERQPTQPAAQDARRASLLLAHAAQCNVPHTTDELLEGLGDTASLELHFSEIG